ncbi:hypothetical protein ABW19_dt0200912 [Dactylella cylindrospora]|nr:hypothetical protein ABW19_dt0200912 [Dactylella cylindrospora]
MFECLAFAVGVQYANAGAEFKFLQRERLLPEKNRSEGIASQISKDRTVETGGSFNGKSGQDFPAALTRSSEAITIASITTIQGPEARIPALSIQETERELMVELEEAASGDGCGDGKVSLQHLQQRDKNVANGNEQQDSGGGRTGIDVISPNRFRVPYFLQKTAPFQASSWESVTSGNFGLPQPTRDPDTDYLITQEGTINRKARRAMTANDSALYATATADVAASIYSS